MTESDWLNGTVLNPLLELVRDRIGQRRMSLLGCGLARQVWHLLSDPRSRKTVELGERFADGAATEEEARRAKWAAAAAVVEVGRTLRGTPREQALPSLAAAVLAAQVGGGWGGPLPVTFGEPGEGQPAFNALIRSHPGVVRDLIGNPFRPPSLDLDRVARPGSAVRELARVIYDERDFTALPVLADLLEEAGCRDPEVISHCRGPGPHVRGCWVLDLLLGKEPPRRVLGTRVLRHEWPPAYWTVPHGVEQEGLYVGMGIAEGHRARLHLRLESHEGPGAVCFANEVGPDSVAPVFHRALPDFIDEVVAGVEEGLAGQAASGRVLAGLRATLLSLVTQTDPRPAEIRWAAARAFLLAVQEVPLIHVGPQSAPAPPHGPGSPELPGPGGGWNRP